MEGRRSTLEEEEELTTKVKRRSGKKAKKAETSPSSSFFSLFSFSSSLLLLLSSFSIAQQSRLHQDHQGARSPSENVAKEVTCQDGESLFDNVGVGLVEVGWVLFQDPPIARFLMECDFSHGSRVLRSGRLSSKYQLGGISCPRASPK